MKKLIYLLIVLIPLFGCKRGDEPGLGGSENGISTSSLVANFSFSEQGNFAPSMFYFTNSSSNATSCYWNFGDGKTSTETNPSHIFTTGGTYNVTLTVRNNKGEEDVINKVITVKKTPTKLYINSVILTSYPITTPNGGGWDAYDGPDIFIKILGKNGTFDNKSHRKSNVTQSMLPIIFNSGLFPCNISETSFNFKYTISFYDYDPIGDNEVMGGYYFTPNDVIPKNGKKYPNTVDFSSPKSQLKFTLNISWE